jgi:hypothetical protein
MRVALDLVGQHEAFHQRPAFRRRHPLRHRNGAALVPVHRAFHVVDEARVIEGPFGDIEQMRACILVNPPGGCRRGQEAGMPAHNDADIDARQSPEIEIDGQEGAGHERAGGNEARRVVVFFKVVVDGLGRVNERHRTAGGVGQDRLRPRRIVATDIDEGVGAHCFQTFEDRVAIGRVRLVAGGAQGCARRACDRQELRFGDGGQVDIAVVADPAHAMQASQNRHAGFARLQCRPRQCLVDHGRRPAPLRNYDGLTHSSPQSLPQIAVTTAVILTRAQTSISTIPAVPVSSIRDSRISLPSPLQP